jgi:hypothetical protein
MSSKLHDNFNGLNLMVHDRISNDIQIALNLKHNKSISLKICLLSFFFSFLSFSMNLY